MRLNKYLSSYFMFITFKVCIFTVLKPLLTFSRLVLITEECFTQFYYTVIKEFGTQLHFLLFQQHAYIKSPILMALKALQFVINLQLNFLNLKLIFNGTKQKGMRVERYDGHCHIGCWGN